MITFGRGWAAGSEYRYGFNGKESDLETYGANNSVDFSERFYDSRLGRWLCIDKLFKKYPGYSNYSYALNNPILFLDAEGNEVVGFYTFLSAHKNGQIEATAIVTQSQLFVDNIINQFDNSNAANPNLIDITFTSSDIVQDAGGNVGDGLTGIFVITKGGDYIDLGSYGGSKDNISGFDIRVQIDHDLSSEEQAETIVHESIVHALQDKVLIDEYYKSGDLSGLQTKYAAQVSDATGSHNQIRQNTGMFNDVNQQIIGAFTDPKNTAFSSNFNYGLDAPNNFALDGTQIISEALTMKEGTKLMVVPNILTTENNVINQYITQVNNDVTNYGGVNTLELQWSPATQAQVDKYKAKIDDFIKQNK